MNIANLLKHAYKNKIKIYILWVIIFQCNILHTGYQTKVYYFALAGKLLILLNLIAVDYSNI